MSGSELRGSKMSDEVAVLEQRHDQAALLTLVELDPPTVADGAWLHGCYVSTRCFDARYPDGSAALSLI
jgi:carbonic anhydrase/acetyltransferase-like protein (isoleucine patch superfamily)